MKKLLVLLLALTVVSGVFAQLTLSGDVRMDMGWGTESNPDVDDSAVSKWYWRQNKDSGTGDGNGIKASIEGGGVKGYAAINADLVFTAGASVGLIDNVLGLSIGYDRLNFAYWSAYDTHADNHWSFGASSISRTAFLQVNIINNAFVGIAEGGKVNGFTIDEKDFLPYIYAGYAHPENGDFAFGLGFAGTTIRGKSKDPSDMSFGDIMDAIFSGKEPDGGYFGYHNDKGEPEDVFAWMGRVYFKYLGIDGVPIGVNVALYGAPEFTIFDIKNNEASKGGGKEAMVLEALATADINVLDVFNLGIGIGLVTNFADKEKDGGSLGFKAGLDAAFDIGGTGFKVIPGFSFAAYDIKHWNGKEQESAKANVLDFGISFCYSF